MISEQQKIFNQESRFEELVLISQEKGFITNDSTDYGVTVPNIKDSVIIRLKLHAPKLRKYFASFITLKHSVVKAYPCFVKYDIDDSEFVKCDTPAQLEETLKMYFQHPNTIQLVISLYEQSKIRSKVG